MPLLEQILADVRRAGPLTFARYMDTCLYHPAHGYYRSGRVKLGPSGDFYTSAHVHAAFARLLVRRWIEMWEELGRGEFTLLEPGAGRGEIAREAPAWAARINPAFAEALRYVPIEFGQAFPEHVAGCIFSNEFFDAQPVHVLRFTSSGEWEELYVGERNGRLDWQPGPPSSEELRHWIRRLEVEPEEGQIIEISPAAARWMTRFARALDRGYVVSIDYGYRTKEISGGRRFFDGSLMSYRKHTASADVLLNPGDRDITAHVNFDLLRLAASDGGMTQAAFTSQGAYLARAGEASRFEDVFAGCTTETDRLRVSLLLKNLLFGIGETMQVQELRKGIRVL